MAAAKDAREGNLHECSQYLGDDPIGKKLGVYSWTRKEKDL